MNSKASAAPGFQIACLIFAVVLLNAPLEKYVLSQWEWLRDLELDIGRALIVISGGLVLLAFPSLRQRCAGMLSRRIPPGKRREIVLGLAMDWLAAYGAIGVFVLLNYMQGGEPALARHMGGYTDHEIAMQKALHPSSLIKLVFAAGFIAPIVEELAFRGFLFRAWKDAWGWVWAAIASAIVFGLFHYPTILPQLLAGLVFVGVVRRAGTLRASIYVHALFNLLAWYPLLGRWMYPSHRSTGELHLWTPHLVCLAVIVIALPWYMWSARDAKLPRE